MGQRKELLGYEGLQNLLEVMIGSWHFKKSETAEVMLPSMPEVTHVVMINKLFHYQQILSSTIMYFASN
jgi:hypothetical protein